MEKTVEILNESGLHARPAALFAKTASKYKSEIMIECNEKASNGKSIMNIISFGLKKGDEIKIIANGIDEKEAMDDLVQLVEGRFGEN